MKLLLDHDVPVEIARVLLQAGHLVLRVGDVMPPDTEDIRVFEYAASRGYVLMTCNRDDFLGLAGERAHAGLVIVIRRRTRIAECAHVLRLLTRAGENGICGNINFA